MRRLAYGVTGNEYRQGSNNSIREFTGDVGSNPTKPAPHIFALTQKRRSDESVGAFQDSTLQMFPSPMELDIRLVVRLGVCL